MKIKSNFYNLFFILFFTTVFLTADKTVPAEIEKEPEKNLFPLSKDDKLWVENKLASLSLKEKCAQLIMVNASSIDTSSDSKSFQRLKKLVSEFKVGGIIFFKGTINNQVYLTNRLQALADIPLLISSDFERGLGMRLEDAVEFPDNMAFGAADDTYLTYLAGKATGREARAIGVHQNYAPTIDVNHNHKNPVINIRSFSDNAKTITFHGNAFIRGLHDGNSLSTAKHFPGHGATDLDSHYDLPLIKLTKEQFYESDLIPFIESIKAGVKSIMVGHLSIPGIDGRENIPATLSKSIVTELLKEELKFHGLIVTDAMNMKAVTKLFTHEEASKLAVLAGNDIVTFPENDSLAIEGIYTAVLNKEISEERIDYSVKKILSVKKWLGLDKKLFIDSNDVRAIVNKTAHKRLAKEVAERAITIVKDEDNLLPLFPAKTSRVVMVTLSDSRRKQTIEKPFAFEKEYLEKAGYAKTFRFNLSSKKKEQDAAAAEIKKSDLVLIASYLSVSSSRNGSSINEDQLKFIRQILASNKPVVFINFGNPYLLMEIPEVKTYLCTFSRAVVSQKAAVSVLLGNTKAGGKLPINIPDTEFITGHGIEKLPLKLFAESFPTDTNYNFQTVDSLIVTALTDSIFPGGVLLAGHRNRIIYNKAFGNFSYQKNSDTMFNAAMFDLSALTMVVGTSAAAMLLTDQNKLDIDNNVNAYLPDFTGGGREKITVKHLLTHNSGLPPAKDYYNPAVAKSVLRDDLLKTKLIYKPGSDYLYSELNMLILQLVIEKIAGMPLDLFLNKELFAKLEMTRTMFNPPPELWFYCVPTEDDKTWRYTTLKGKVNDKIAYLLGGVAGNAGLFSTASDLANFIFVFLNKGMFMGKRFFKQSTIDEFTSIQTNYGERGLGWDIKASDALSAAGELFSMSSFGHNGQTGTSIWVDKQKELFVILLTNSSYSPSRNKILYFRPKLHDEIVKAARYNF